ncbi:SDR family oxidoreductase [Pseudactinotalea sp. HY158]|uniref:SDR family NAD(P)-dependent oxidoreductase n=1 Tax=unclassified Pseudactinotalea TaxID=2649176 RepID=UPI001E58B942|nr:SDR family oxidoreductase [Pseudactinotalea sp. HY158]
MSAPEPSVVRGRALITGGSAGIGLAFAKALAARGCDLVLVARTQAALERAAERLRTAYGVEVSLIAADLSTREGTDAVTTRLAAEPPIDILVNNAGSGLHEPFVTENMAAHTRGIDLMVTAPLLLGSAAAAAMTPRGHGLIINVGSVAGLIAMNNYSAIKAWMNTFSDALGLELIGTGVHVMTLLPGWVRTEFHQRAKVEASRIPSWLWLSADRLAADTLAAVEKGKSRVVPSKRFKILAWLASHAPRPAVEWATSRIKKGRREK